MTYATLYPTEQSIANDNRAFLQSFNDADFANEIRQSINSGTLNAADLRTARQTLAEVEGRMPAGQQPLRAGLTSAPSTAGQSRSWVDNWLPNYSAQGDGGITPEQAAVSGGHTGQDAINSPGAAASSAGGWLADKLGDVSVVVLGVVIVGIGLVFAAKSAGVPMPIPKVG